MTEQQWLKCAEPKPMFTYLQPAATERKRRLFACACCWRIEKLLSASGKTGVEAAEQFADGTITQTALHSAWKAIGFPKKSSQRFAASAARAAATPWPLSTIDNTEHAFASALNASEQTKLEGEAQASLIREIFGNPFRLVAIDPEWLAWQDGTVVKIAQSIYEERAFANLPVLADALEEAGCANVELIAHCRHPGPHVRGCWAVDLLLGKT